MLEIRSRETASNLGVFGAVWEGEVAVLYCQCTLSEGKTKEAKLVQETTQGPDIRLGSDGLPTVEVDHLRSSASLQVSHDHLHGETTCRRVLCTSLCPRPL